jgi:hypothetical protein
MDVRFHYGSPSSPLTSPFSIKILLIFFITVTFSSGVSAYLIPHEPFFLASIERPPHRPSPPCITLFF